MTFDDALSLDLDDATYLERHGDDVLGSEISIANVADSLSIGSTEDSAARRIAVTQYAAKSILPTMPIELIEASSASSISSTNSGRRYAAWTPPGFWLTSANVKTPISIPLGFTLRRA